MIATCEQCGKEFRTSPGARKNGKGRFCSRPCADTHKKTMQPVRFWSYVDQSGGPDACWPWTRACTPAGYGHYAMLGRQDCSHRFSYELTHGPIPKGAYVLHSCCNPKCCNPAHLRLGTAFDNMQDAIGAGHRNDLPRGEKHYRHKLTRNDVREIRFLRASGVKGRGLAAMYKVSQATVCDLVKRRTWTHL